MSLPAAATSSSPIPPDRHNKGAVAVLVDVREKPERAVRINVTLPEDLVRSIDRVAANRSRFLAAAARDRLRRQRKSA
jgi:hypothetical protein